MKSVVPPCLAVAATVAACTPNHVTHATAAKRAAADSFQCGADQVTIRDEGAEVYMVEGCGQVASFYCTEDASLQMKCERVSSPDVIAAHENLAAALAAQDKADAEERRKLEESGSATTTAKSADDSVSE